MELIERYDKKHLKKVEARISIDRKKIVIACRLPEVTDKFIFSKYIGERTFKVLPTIEYIKKEHESNIKKRNYRMIKAKKECHENNGTEVFYFEYEGRGEKENLHCEV